MKSILKLSIRNPIESIAFVLVAVSIPLYWLWSSIRNEDLFRRPSLEVHSKNLNYLINNEQASLIQPDSPQSVPSHLNKQLSNADLYMLVFRVHGAFDSNGIIKTRHIQRIQNYVDSITTPQLSKDSNDLKSNDFSKILSSKIVFSPFSNHSITGDDAVYHIDPKFSHLLLDKRISPKGYVTGAQAAIVAIYLNTNSASQKAQASAWWDHAKSNVPDTFIDSSVSFSDSNQKISSLFIEDRSGFPLLAVIGQNLLWRVSNLISETNPSEISLVLFTYSILMAFLIQLFSTMRSFGSKFSLGITVVIIQVASVSLALFTFKIFSIEIESVLLSESLPFLFICHGFDKHIALARSVLLSFVQNFKSSNSLKSPISNSRNNNTSPITSNKLVENGIDNCLSSLVRSYAFEFAILASGCMSGIESIRSACSFAILVLSFDVLFMFTTYTSILTLKINLLQSRISALKKPSAKSDVLKSINYKTLISEASHKDTKLISRIKLLGIFGFLLMNFMDLKFSYKNFASIPKNVISKSFDFDSSGSSQIDSFIKPIILNISQLSSIKFPLNLSINIPAKYVLKSAISQSSNDSTSPYPFTLGLLSELINSTIKPVHLFFVLAISVFLNIYFVLLRKQVASKATKNTRRKTKTVLSYLGLQKINDSLSSSNSSVSLSTNVSSSNTDESNTDEPDSPELTAKKILSISDESIEIETESNSNDLQKIDTVALTFNKDGKLDEVSTNFLKSKLELLSTCGPENLLDQEIVDLVNFGFIQQYALEGKLKDPTRAVKVRRIVTFSKTGFNVDEINVLPYENYDYSSVVGQCCENVVGFMPIPVGMAGPLLINDESLYIPMATTEGALIASTSRGCKAISLSGGVSSFLVNDGMTRGPCLEMVNLKSAYELKMWLDSEDGFQELKESFESTSRFAKLLSIKTTLAGRLCFIRFKTFTGDAMGMNMISKGCEKSLRLILEKFEGSKVISISGNYCTDKKPASINWIEGRGKSIVAEAVIPESIVSSVLKTTVSRLVEVNTKKNLVGSSMAGAMGGFNAHASNILTAIFLATGQDPAQNVESSMCLTFMEQKGDDLVISVTMPCIEVGTIGGGTGLKPQQSCLSMLGCLGPNYETPGANAQRLAKIIAGTVMAGELSLLAALTTGDLVKSHIKLNRKPNN
ncbi:3-hydroxy-3-methylglutaryl-coenzyme A reductase [Smittium culicis]|uniref:3-hydroxy-3-methylglutaryl coenzyme A reductase n=1 Tax=Smittium culicis TaxID=133412 RepID=A0A1R1Y5J4_9FUNG|nr:3-hydroxy-3-methylglutaryl-coenzyme A reductase [Smittium culicis]